MILENTNDDDDDECLAPSGCVHFKPNHNIFPKPNRVILVCKPNQTMVFHDQNHIYNIVSMVAKTS